jgi:hypothetical protein
VREVIIMPLSSDLTLFFFTAINEKSLVEELQLFPVVKMISIREYFPTMIAEEIYGV